MTAPKEDAVRRFSRKACHAVLRWETCTSSTDNNDDDDDDDAAEDVDVRALFPLCMCCSCGWCLLPISSSPCRCFWCCLRASSLSPFSSSSSSSSVHTPTAAATLACAVFVSSMFGSLCLRIPMLYILEAVAAFDSLDILVFLPPPYVAFV